MDFTDKVAIVTGAGQGIGKRVATKVAELGADVAVVDLNPDTAQQTVSEIEASGRKAIAVPTDVGVKTQVDAMVQQVVERFGRVDVLCNVAGWSRNQGFLEDDAEYWDRVIDINYKAVVFACRAVLDKMIEQGSGAIVNVSSDAARVGTPRQAVYAGAKGAVISFTKALCTEVAKHGVRMNVVSPSTTDTPLTRSVLNDEQIARREKAIPLRRLGQPDDQASAILFFASDDARYITGQVLSVNGGSSRVG